ncbi:hypothetical protein ACFPJ1_09715 [Kribbella qitaiheensis]|uniref:hypothetical protein n=1 Tax=Kribbella qitaiheensis TaxID=1544730 RepID=UPI00361022F6
MELGIALPTSGPLASSANIAQVAREAERLGYSAVWSSERLLRPVQKVAPWYGDAPEIFRLTFEPL